MSQPTQKQDKQTLPDEEIVSLYWKRDERAIEETDIKYRCFLYTIAQNILKDRMDSEECLNDTYLGAWNRIPPAKPDPFQAFIAKIMRNIAVDKYRKKTAEKRIPSELSLSLVELDDSIYVSPSAEEAFLIKELARVLNSFVLTLQDKQEFIFVCRYYFADKVDTIAAMLKTSPRTVYRELSVIRESLKQYLEQEGFGREETGSR